MDPTPGAFPAWTMVWAQRDLAWVPSRIRECPELDSQGHWSSCPGQPNNPSVVQTFLGLWSCAHSLGRRSSAQHPLEEEPFLIPHLTLPDPAPAVPVPVSILFEMFSPLPCFPGRRECLFLVWFIGNVFLSRQVSVPHSMGIKLPKAACLCLPADSIVAKSTHGLP